MTCWKTGMLLFRDNGKFSEKYLAYTEINALPLAQQLIQIVEN